MVLHHHSCSHIPGNTLICVEILDWDPKKCPLLSEYVRPLSGALLFSDFKLEINFHQKIPSETKRVHTAKSNFLIQLNILDLQHKDTIKAGGSTAICKMSTG